jgi:hypothetical protein
MFAVTFATPRRVENVFFLYLLLYYACAKQHRKRKYAFFPKVTTIGTTFSLPFAARRQTSSETTTTTNTVKQPVKRRVFEHNRDAALVILQYHLLMIHSF